MKKGIVLMIVSSLMTCTGQMMWKLAGLELKPLFLLVGVGLYGLGAVCMIIALRFGDVSVLQPMLSTGFVIAIFLGALVLQETITWNKILGTILIVIGMVLLGRSGRKAGT